jgi:hypothetical protein
MLEMNSESYKKYVDELGADARSEEYEDDQIWDLAKCCIDGRDDESRAAIKYLKSIGVRDFVGRLADDIKQASMRWCSNE